MLKAYVIASMLTAGAPVATETSQANPGAQILAIANAYDRCVTTYAVKLLESGLSDEQLYIVASTMCRDLQDHLKQKITAALPGKQADDVLAALNADPKGDYFKKLNAIRQGRLASRK